MLREFKSIIAHCIVVRLHTASVVIKLHENLLIVGLNTNQENQYMKLKKSVINGDLVLVESIINSQNDKKGNINMAAEEGSTLLFL